MSKIFYELPPDLKDACPVIFALELIGQKWKIPVLWHLSEDGALYYSELRRKIYGITNIMLTKSLRDLEASGLVHRQQFDTNPPRVRYSLTERGKSLVPILKELERWGKSQMAQALTRL